MTRTPETFSCRLALTTAIAWRTRMNVRRARICQSHMMMTSTGTVLNVTAVSWKSWTSRKTMTRTEPEEVGEDGEHARGQQVLQHGDVVLHARHHAADLVAVEEAERELLDVVEHLGAQLSRMRWPT